MKVGDAVMFIGFEGLRAEDEPSEWIGLVLRVYRMHRQEKTLRANVLWPDGRIGIGLYEETLEVISESR